MQNKRQKLILLTLSLSLGAIWLIFDSAKAQAQTAIYRSAAPSATSDLNTSARTVTISGTTATFSGAMPTNVGVGDVLQYNPGSGLTLAFISGRTSDTVYSVQSASGGTPTAAAGGTAVSVFRAYTSLTNAESGIENTGIDTTIRNFDDWTAGGTAATDDVGRDLVTNNEQWNIALYANGSAADTGPEFNGWTTGAANFVRIYTPYLTSEVGASQRHRGRWDDFKYHIYNTSGYFEGVDVRLRFLVIDGLQIYNNQAANPAASLILNSVPDNGGYTISNNILRNNGTANCVQGDGTDKTYTVNMYNNIIHDCAVGIDNNWNRYAIWNIYNNTISSATTGISNLRGGVSVFRSINNIVQATTGFSDAGTALSGTGYNITSDVTAPGSGSKTNTVPSFIASSEKDLHLTAGDTAAKNAGSDLHLDSILPFSVDIDGHSRPNGAWDIGADEAASAIYRSSGFGTTSDLNANGRTLTISGTTATFSDVMPTNVGVGDVLQYQVSTAYYVAFISGRTSSTVFAVQSSTGGAPQAASAGTPVNVYRAYTSLAKAESGDENDSLDNSVEDFDNWDGVGDYTDTDEVGKDIFASNEQWNIVAYADAPEANLYQAMTIDGWTTNSPNYIKVFAPTASNEVGISQRHAGKWDDSKFRIVSTANSSSVRGIVITDEDVTIEGLQISLDGANAYGTLRVLTGLSFTNNQGRYYAGANIIRATNIAADTALGGGAGIDYVPSLIGGGSRMVAYNNIVYGFNRIGTGWDLFKGISKQHRDGWMYAYNNTVYDCGYGFARIGSSDTMVVVNNIAQNTQAGFLATNATYSNYNISNLADAPGANSKSSATVGFVNATAKDFHLASSDTTARNSGSDLSADTNFSFATDIDGAGRVDGSWDIGADEYVLVAGGNSAFTQTAYQWFANASSPQPGAALAALNTEATIAANVAAVRVRMGVTVSAANLDAGSQSFRLQWSPTTTGSWKYVDNLGFGWQYYNNGSVSDGDAISASLLNGGNLLGLYKEAANLTANPVQVNAGQTIEYDFSLDPARNPYGETFYFRLVRSDSTPFETYTSYPKITIGTGNLTRGGGGGSMLGGSGGGAPATGGTSQGAGVGTGGSSGGGTPTGGGTQQGGGGATP